MSSELHSGSMGHGHSTSGSSTAAAAAGGGGAGTACRRETGGHTRGEGREGSNSPGNTKRMQLTTRSGSAATSAGFSTASSAGAPPGGFLLPPAPLGGMTGGTKLQE